MHTHNCLIHYPTNLDEAYQWERSRNAFVNDVACTAPSPQISPLRATEGGRTAGREDDGWDDERSQGISLSKQPV